MNRSLSCIIVDDEPAAIKLLEAFVKKLPFLEHQGSFDDPEMALNFLKTHHTDILITDIQMPGLTGLKMVQSLSVAPEIIFTTAHRDFAADGFEVNAADYLLKPLNFERFQIAINKVRDRLQSRWSFEQKEKDFLFIKQGSSHLKISYDEIACIEANGDFVKILKTDQSDVVTRNTLAELENTLPQGRFLRVHKSFIVNASMISAVNPFQIKLKNGEEVPISKHYKDAVNQLIG